MNRAERLEAVGRIGVARRPRRRGCLLGDGGEEDVHCNTRRSGVVDAPGGVYCFRAMQDASNTAGCKDSLSLSSALSLPS